MKLTLNNIGKFHNETTIQFDGITILAGDNGSGKSTISKALYGIFHGFYNIEQKIYFDRKHEILNVIINNSFPKEGSRRWRSLSVSFVDQLMEDYAEEKNVQSIIDRINESKMQFDDDMSPEELARRIEKVLLIPDQEICKRLLARTLQEKYDGNIANVNFPEDNCSIRLNLKNKELSVSISPDGQLTYQREIELLRDIIYVDDFFSGDRLFGRGGLYSSYRWTGVGLRSDINMEESAPTAAGELLNEQKASGILSLMASAGIGEMCKNEDGSWVYTAGNLRKPISVENISSGTKAFLALKYLLLNDQIDKKGVLVFDEPEVHLHPKWQELYAEIIILLQKIYDLTLLVSTHSADFVSFLEYYMRKYDRVKYCHYYLMNDDTSGLYATVEEVTDHTDKIYKELSLPYIRVSEKLAEEEDLED